MRRAPPPRRDEVEDAAATRGRAAPKRLRPAGLPVAPGAADGSLFTSAQQFAEWRRCAVRRPPIAAQRSRACPPIDIPTSSARA